MSTAEAEHGPEVTELLVEEHRDAAREIQALLEAQDLRNFRGLLESLAGRLSRHEAAEELAVYPVLLQIEDGAELRNRALEQERAAKFAINRLLRRSLWHPRGHQIRRMIQRLGDQIAAHASFEEEQIFPLLERCTDLEKRRMMGAWVENAESLAPVRPHPRVPQSFLSLVAAGPFLAIADRLRSFTRRKFEGR